eukprot:1153308-Pelagomonas_calceolata.AAC.2
MGWKAGWPYTLGGTRRSVRKHSCNHSSVPLCPLGTCLHMMRLASGDQIERATKRIPSVFFQGRHGRIPGRRGAAEVAVAAAAAGAKALEPHCLGMTSQQLTVSHTGRLAEAANVDTACFSNRQAQCGHRLRLRTHPKPTDSLSPHWLKQQKWTQHDGLRMDPKLTA